MGKSKMCRYSLKGRAGGNFVLTSLILVQPKSKLNTDLLVERNAQFLSVHSCIELNKLINK